MMIEIDAPWGKLSVDENAADRNRKLVEHCVAQLKYFRDVTGNTTEYLARDLKAYEMILQFEDFTIDEFIRTKQEAIKDGTRFADNLAVIENMKKRGVMV